MHTVTDVRVCTSMRVDVGKSLLNIFLINIKNLQSFAIIHLSNVGNNVVYCLLHYYLWLLLLLLLLL